MVLGHARGVMLLAAAEAGVAVGGIPAGQGEEGDRGPGRGTKDQVGYMVAQLLRLLTAPAPADAADGVAIALTHLMLSGRAPRLPRPPRGAAR